MGHGAIEWFLGLTHGAGRNQECEDFSSPKNFPAEIVKAIKAGNFCGIGICEGILTKEALADYKAKRAPLYADYDAKRDALYADYEAKRDALYADYDAKRDALYADYKAKRDALFWKIAKQKKNRRKEWK
jgi:hypothetical protein